MNANAGVNRFQLPALALLIAFPLIPKLNSGLPSANQAATYAIVAASLVLLTGWVGQISLGHAALVGIGGYAAGWAATALGLPFPLNLPVAAAAGGGMAALLGVVALRVRGLYLAVATLIFSWAASEMLFRQQWILKYGSIPEFAIGRPGTLFRLDFSNSRTAFFYIAWGIAVACLYGLTNLRDSKTGRAFFAIRGSEFAAASLGMDVLRYKTLAFTLSGALAGIAGCLIVTEARVISPESFDFNRSLFYLAIAVVGGLASLPGAVAAAVFFAFLGELFFRVQFLGDYLQLVSTGLLAIVFRLYPGGLAALGRLGLNKMDARAAAKQQGVMAVKAPRTGGGLGARAKAMFSNQPGAVVAPQPSRQSSPSPTMSTADGFMNLSSILEPGAGEGTAAAEMPEFSDQTMEIDATELVETVPRGRAAQDADTEVFQAVEGEDAAYTKALSGKLQLPPGVVAPPPADPALRHERRPLITAEHITVKFGGLVAVDDASLEVREGEIVGLIGPNGAGKTTLFNSIAGFNTPTTGRVILYGNDVTALPVYQRAALGMARTFQRIQLFPQLSTFDNLLAATHLQNPTGFVQHMAVTRAAYTAEAQARARVKQVLHLLDLEDVAHRNVGVLPFGVLRMIEVARAVVTGSRVIMLDEPASGLDERETDRLTDVLRFVRDLGATLLLIEHDVRMVTAVTDYMYVLNQGQMIAEGSPADIQSNEDVIAAYLGQSTESEKAGV